MRVLAIETATALCSVALLDEGRLIASDEAVVGRGHAERLLPMIAELPGGGRADAVWVDCGPGSFTGVRVGIAAARALGFGWGVPVHGYSSLSLIAATWLEGRSGEQVTVVIEGGHGEVLVQSFDGRVSAVTSVYLSVTAEDAVDHCFPTVIGNAAWRIAVLKPGIAMHDVKPSAENVAQLFAAPISPTPIYARAPDARPMF